jgi:large conductance mechanosensitive channel
MATNETPSGQNFKPLSKKTDAELQREAKARLKRMDPATAASLVSEVVGKPVTGSVSGFVNFLREHAIVGLAVGFVLGAQVQAVVQAFITGLINPLFELMPGGKGLTDRIYNLNLHGHTAHLKWGTFAYALLNFLVVAGTVYLIIRIFRLDKLDKKK